MPKWIYIPTPEYKRFVKHFNSLPKINKGLDGRLFSRVSLPHFKETGKWVKYDKRIKAHRDYVTCIENASLYPLHKTEHEIQVELGIIPLYKYPKESFGDTMRRTLKEVRDKELYYEAQRYSGLPETITTYKPLTRWQKFKLTVYVRWNKLRNLMGTTT